MTYSDSSRSSPSISIHSYHVLHITLTNRINYHFLSFIQCHHCASLSTLIPFHHSFIFHFSTHPFHHGALRHFLKTHFLSFHLSYPPIHYSILLSFLFQLHHYHRDSSLLFIPIRIYVLYSFISIHSHPILPINHFYHTHPYPFPFPFQSSHFIPFRHSHSFSFLFWLFIFTRFTVLCNFFYRHSFISSIPILIPLYSILHIPFMSFLRFSSSFPNYEIYTMFVRILLIALPFVVLIGNTLCQLDVLAYASDVWFQSSGIEWWGNGIMLTWWLQGIYVGKAVVTEFDSTWW